MALQARYFIPSPFDILLPSSIFICSGNMFSLRVRSLKLFFLFLLSSATFCWPFFSLLHC
jgi:hypothetical protein